MSAEQLKASNSDAPDEKNVTNAPKNPEEESNAAQLVQLQQEYDLNLKQLYLLKAKEMVLEIKFESWKVLYRKQEALLSERFSKARTDRMAIWKDRVEFCSEAREFAEMFSMDRTLLKIAQSQQDVDSPEAIKSETVVEEPDPFASRSESLDRQEAGLRQKAAELDQMELELAPDEETVRRLQDAVQSSAQAVDDMEEEIRLLKSMETEPLPQLSKAEELDSRSILKRPSFMALEIDRKQVRFE
ncbi:uncharacterized protein LOC129759518 [Uranotaenia lowii]|uniref:uncharacterized protein LOC129759518 n=1 Tax=Uranotaenia lowii TaxID=190385 RepID=UPI002478A590|nr:uncharacterized protein LOC129759518 [Uranotaenia lowii]